MTVSNQTFDDGEFVRPVRPLPSEDLHRAACVDFIDLGMQMNARFGKSEHKGKLVFELDEKVPEKDYNHTVSVKFTISFHQKALLAKLLNDWGVAIPAEGEGFKFSSLRNRPAKILVKHAKSQDGRVFANIASLMPDKTKNPFIPSGKYKRWIPENQQQPRSSKGFDANSAQRAADEVDDEVPF
jgi:hypothetical protein